MNGFPGARVCRMTASTGPCCSDSDACHGFLLMLDEVDSRVSRELKVSDKELKW